MVVAVPRQTRNKADVAGRHAAPSHFVFYLHSSRGDSRVRSRVPFTWLLTYLATPRSIRHTRWSATRVSRRSGHPTMPATPPSRKKAACHAWRASPWLPRAFACTAAIPLCSTPTPSSHRGSQGLARRLVQPASLRRSGSVQQGFRRLRPRRCPPSTNDVPTRLNGDGGKRYGMAFQEPRALACIIPAAAATAANDD